MSNSALLTLMAILLVGCAVILALQFTGKTRAQGQMSGAIASAVASPPVENVRR